MGSKGREASSRQLKRLPHPSCGHYRFRRPLVRCRKKATTIFDEEIDWNEPVYMTKLRKAAYAPMRSACPHRYPHG